MRVPNLPGQFILTQEEARRLANAFGAVALTPEDQLLWQRLRQHAGLESDLGPLPEDGGCWTYEDDRIASEDEPVEYALHRARHGRGAWAGH